MDSLRTKETACASNEEGFCMFFSLQKSLNKESARPQFNLATCLSEQ